MPRRSRQRLNASDCVERDYCKEGLTSPCTRAATNKFPRSVIAICGLVSQYNATEAYGLKNIRYVLTSRIRMQGFIVSDHFDMMPAFAADMAGWLKDGKIKYRETVVEGIETMPKALVGLFRGENFGKLIVKVGHEPN